ncbi:hypothetical protein DFH09DRAFT_1287388 [Mycena vulgaris]|nr:hypothetical protein DFH09DRAFT_1287388 [Mycena vulgaris]
MTTITRRAGRIRRAQAHRVGRIGDDLAMFKNVEVNDVIRYVAAYHTMGGEGALMSIMTSSGGKCTGNAASSITTSLMVDRGGTGASEFVDIATSIGRSTVYSPVGRRWCSFGLPAIGPLFFLAPQDPPCCSLKLRISASGRVGIGDRRGIPEAVPHGAARMVGGVPSDSLRTHRMRTVRGRKGGSADGMMDEGEAVPFGCRRTTRRSRGRRDRVQACAMASRWSSTSLNGLGWRSISGRLDAPSGRDIHSVPRFETVSPPTMVKACAMASQRNMGLRDGVADEYRPARRRHRRSFTRGTPRGRIGKEMSTVHEHGRLREGEC